MISNKSPIPASLSLRPLPQQVAREVCRTALRSAPDASPGAPAESMCQRAAQLALKRAATELTDMATVSLHGRDASYIDGIRAGIRAGARLLLYLAGGAEEQAETE